MNESGLSLIIIFTILTYMPFFGATAWLSFILYKLNNNCLYPLVALWGYIIYVNITGLSGMYGEWLPTPIGAFQFIPYIAILLITLGILSLYNFLALKFKKK